MADIVFARPRHLYDSYQDLYRLIELSGFDMAYFDEIDAASDNTYICTVVNGENQQGWESPRARIILWDLEWRLDGEYPRIPGVAEVWCSDKWYAGHVGARYVPMGSHPELKPFDLDHVPDVEYHAAYLGYMIPRRTQIWTDLKARGLRLSPTGAWGADRHRVLMGSACYLHVHQRDDAPGMPPLRLVVAAAYSLPFISETIRDPGIFGQTYFMQSAYAHLADFVRMWTCDSDRNRLNDYGRALHDLLCRDLTFRRSVEKAV